MELAQYKHKWSSEFSRLGEIRYPKQLLDYWPV